jgi:formate hydrogenlyase subunit 6/NADH:ubiquinone oxidoreductase subunit I
MLADAIGPALLVVLDALTDYYELAFTSREDAIWTKEQLLEPPPPLGSDPVDREG